MAEHLIDHLIGRLIAHISPLSSLLGDKDRFF